MHTAWLLISAGLISTAWAALTEQTFCRPTRDSVFKHVLSDELTRKSFIRSLSPFKNIMSSDLMSSELRPLSVDENLLNILKIIDFQSFVMKPQHLEVSSALLGSLTKQSDDLPKSFPFLQAAMESNPEAVQKELRSLRKEYAELSLCKNFFAALRKKFDQILLALLYEKKGVCDIVSRLDTGEIVLVEAQVEKKDSLDQRFLAHACSLYSHQIRAGMEWSKIKNVASIILISHDIGKSLGWPANEYKRHYLMTNQMDEAGRNKWPYVQVIIYCLPKVNLASTVDPLERSWLEFFKSAETLDEIPPNTPEEVAIAYERTRRRNLPRSVILGIESEDAHLENMAGVLQEERNEGKREVLQSLLEDGIITKEQYNERLEALYSAADKYADTL